VRCIGTSALVTPSSSIAALFLGRGRPPPFCSASNSADSSFSSPTFQRGEPAEIQRLIGIRDCEPGLGTSG